VILRAEEFRDFAYIHVMREAGFLLSLLPLLAKALSPISPPPIFSAAAGSRAWSIEARAAAK